MISHVTGHVISHVTSHVISHVISHVSSHVMNHTWERCCEIRVSSDLELRGDIRVSLTAANVSTEKL